MKYIVMFADIFLSIPLMLLGFGAGFIFYSLRHGFKAYYELLQWSAGR